MRVDELIHFLQVTAIDKKHPAAQVCFMDTNGKLIDVDSVYLKDRTILVLGNNIVLPKEAN